jgi:hypothetical protein
MSLLRAAISILKETGREMTATEVARIALERGLVESSGRLLAPHLRPSYASTSAIIRKVRSGKSPSPEPCGPGATA